MVRAILNLIGFLISAFAGLLMWIASWPDMVAALVIALIVIVWLVYRIFFK